MFPIPILNILEEIKDNDHTLLDRVIRHLYVEKKVPPKSISILLGISEATVHKRISKESRKIKREMIKTEILERHVAGSHPKEIAFDLEVSISLVYRTLKEKEC